MNAAFATLRHGGESFFRWWFGELRSLVPAVIVRAFQPQPRIVRIEAAGRDLTFKRIADGTTETIATFPLESGPDDTSKRDLARRLKAYNPARWDYRLYLRNGEVLRDRIWMPAAVVENLHEAVGFQLDRQTPFKSDEIYFDCRVANASGSTVAIDVAISRRDTVDAAVERVRAAGIPVDFVTCDEPDGDGDPPFSLLQAKSSPGSGWKRRANMFLVALAVLLAATAIWLPMERDRERAQLLSLKVETLRKIANGSERLLASLETAQKRLGFVTRRKRTTPSVTRVLDDLTRLVPDNSWVSRFSYDNGTVRIVMHAPESAAIVRLIEGSESFADARMLTAVRRDREDKRERFSLSFSVRGEPTSIVSAARDGK